MIYNMRGDTYHAGPVMLSDVYTSAVGSAKDGVAASQRALYDSYNTLKSSVVTSITRSGLNFTAKNSSGTQLFTFNQQDTTYSSGAPCVLKVFSTAQGTIVAGGSYKITPTAPSGYSSVGPIQTLTEGFVGKAYCFADGTIYSGDSGTGKITVYWLFQRNCRI